VNDLSCCVDDGGFAVHDVAGDCDAVGGAQNRVQVVAAISTNGSNQRANFKVLAESANLVTIFKKLARKPPNLTEKKPKMSNKQLTTKIN